MLGGGTYEGLGFIDVRVYQIMGPELTLDLVQRLRSPADTAYLYFDHVYFVAIQWRDADQHAIQVFAHELEKRLSAR